MKSRMVTGLVLAIVAFAGLGIGAEACKDEEGVAQSALQTVADVVDTVKKESQTEFENKFHQKSTTNKLTFAISAVDDLVQCLDKAGQGGDQAAGAKKDAETKLEDRLTHYHDSLKSTDDPKSAKAMIATFDLSSK